MADKTPKAIVVDTREKTPVVFPGRRIVRAALKYGDYALDGQRTYAAVERKGGWDWVTCNMNPKAKQKLKDQLFRLLDNVERPLLLVEPLPMMHEIQRKFPALQRGFRLRALQYIDLWSEVLPVRYANSAALSAYHICEWLDVVSRLPKIERSKK